MMMEHYRNDDARRARVIFITRRTFTMCRESGTTDTAEINGYGASIFVKKKTDH